MGETLTGVEAIAKHYSVTNRMVWSWFARGMPNEITLEGSHMIFISAADEWLENNFKLLFDGNYQVQIQCDKKVIWSHGEKGGFPYGMTNRSYHQDGTMGQIAAALKRALGQCGYHVETTPHDGSIKKLPVN